MNQTTKTPPIATKYGCSPTKPTASGIAGTTTCNIHHLCCYLRRPLPLTPPQQKKHVNKLILSAISAFQAQDLSAKHAALSLLDSAVAYAETHRLFAHEAKAQLYRGHLLLNLGCPAEASWCATRAFGWVEKGTGVEGNGQRWAAGLKIHAEKARAALPEGDPRKILSQGFKTVPGRESGMQSPRRGREAERREAMRRRWA